MTDMRTSQLDDEPTDDEIAAALAAVRLMLRRRSRPGASGSRWAQAGRIEASGRPAARRHLEHGGAPAVSAPAASEPGRLARC